MCTSSRSHSSVGRYAMYQANSFQESLTDDAAAAAAAATPPTVSGLVGNEEAVPANTSSPSKEKTTPACSNKLGVCEDGSEARVGKCRFTKAGAIVYRRRNIRCEPPKTVAPPLTDQTKTINGLCWVLNNSFRLYKWRHQSDFEISTPV